MLNNDKLIPLKKLQVKPDHAVKLKNYNTDYSADVLSRDDAAVMLQEGLVQLAKTQDKLYAHNRYSVLIIFQAMDAAGKDGAVKHIMSGFNPQGVKVYSFKAPTSNELDHDFIWRHYMALPARGEIAIHNRSHYENVLVTRVHPEYILNENIPGIDSLKDIDQKFWDARLKQINRFEKNLAESGTIILKFFLHISKDEQKKRFLERIDEDDKNWKFSIGDLNERARWDDYQKAYEEAISATSKKHAPWFIIPADDKWYARLAIAAVIYRKFEKLKISYPTLDETQKAMLQKARLQLMNELKNDDSNKPKKRKQKAR
jgi:PPK2 family polyphosphate:nucleotide phosphotransferase